MHSRWHQELSKLNRDQKGVLEPMARILSRDDLPFDGSGWEFEGGRYDNTPISCILIEAPPGGGPKLHSHPYAEVFIIQEGRVTFTVGSETIEAGAGQIIIAPANVPHAFVNSGTGTLRQVDIHLNPHFVTTWYEEGQEVSPEQVGG